MKTSTWPNVNEIPKDLGEGASSDTKTTLAEIASLCRRTHRNKVGKPDYIWFPITFSGVQRHNPRPTLLCASPETKVLVRGSDQPAGFLTWGTHIFF